MEKMGRKFAKNGKFWIIMSSITIILVMSQLLAVNAITEERVKQDRITGPNHIKEPSLSKNNKNIKTRDQEQFTIHPQSITSPDKLELDAFDKYNETGSFLLYPSQVLYWNVTLEYINVRSFEYGELWGQTSQSSKVMDLYVMKEVDFNNFLQGLSFSYEQHASNIHEGKLIFDASIAGTTNYVFAIVNYQSSVKVDYIFTINTNLLPAYYAHANIDNEKTIDPGSSFALKNNFDSNSVIEGGFDNYVDSDCIEFFMFASSEYSKWMSGSDTYTPIESLSCINEIEWGPIRPPGPDDYYYIFSAKNEPDAVTLAYYFDIYDIASTSPYIRVRSPQQNDNWYTGMEIRIDWWELGVDTVNLELYKNGVYNQAIANNIASNGGYDWTVPDGLTSDDHYTIKISDSTNSSIFVLSDEFSIKQPYITIDSPKSNAFLITGNSYEINWTSGGIDQYVDIELHTSDGFYEYIASSVPNTGSYNWTISSQVYEGRDYFIVITDGKTTDESDYIIISKPKSITMNSNVVNSIFELGDQISIKWSSTGIIDHVDIKLFRGKVFYKIIGSGLSNSGSNQFTIGNDLAYGTLYNIRIFDATDAGVVGKSDYFRINGKNPPLTGNGDDGSLDPVVDGFNFPLEVGVFWRYKWDLTETDWVQPDPAKTTKTAGEFEVSLVSSILIDGIRGYSINVTADPNGDGFYQKPRWNYIATYQHQFLGSKDGNSWEIIIDALDENWSGGGGFFLTYDTNTILQLTSSSLSNDYIDQTGYSLAASEHEGGCEYYPGVGKVCDDSEWTYSITELFTPFIGPVGIHYYSSYSSNSGGFFTSFSDDGNIGLVEWLVPNELVIPTRSSTSNSDVTTGDQTSDNSIPSEGVDSNGSSLPFFVAVDLIMAVIIVAKINNKIRRGCASRVYSSR